MQSKDQLNPDENRKHIVELLFRNIKGYDFPDKQRMARQLGISFDKKGEGQGRKKRKTSPLSPSFLIEYLQQQIEENQSTIDFLRTTYGEPTAEKLCGNQARDIVIQSALIDKLYELQELQKIQARHIEFLDARLDSLKALQPDEYNSKSKPDPHD